MPLSDDDDILAAEQALGLADAGARAEHDADFAAAVDAWRGRFAPWLGPDREAPPGVWSRIARALPANDDPARPWRFATAAATAVAALLLGVIVLRPSEVAPPPPAQIAATSQPARMMVAALAPESGPGNVAVSYDPRDGRLLVMPSGIDAGGRTPELWVIPADGKPRSLGTMPDKSAATMTVAAAHRAMLTGGVTLAISLEPAGGSPTGQPTGPVVMTGAMSRV